MRLEIFDAAGLSHEMEVLADERGIRRNVDAAGAHQVQDLTEQELEKLPFGAIQLDTAGRILPFNGFESQISGVSKEQAVGKLFFTEIAPCTNVKESCGRLKKV